MSHDSRRRLLESDELRALVRRRWTVSLLATAALCLTYYGFILLVALDRDLLARRAGAVTTVGIPVAAGVIVVAWALTALYVRWANRAYDPAVDRLRAHLDDSDGAAARDVAASTTTSGEG